MSTERVQRPMPERTAPLRNMTTAYRRSDPRARKRPRRDGPIASSEDVVIEAVKLGYRIADDQILRGQAFARRLRGAGLASDSGDFTDVVDQAMRLTKHLAVLLVEMAETTTQPTKVFRAWREILDDDRRDSRARDATKARSGDGRGYAGEGPSGEGPSGRGHPPHAEVVPIEVASRRPARVALRLTARLKGTPDVYPLYLKDDPKHTLGKVEFVLHNGAPVLRVIVDDKSPPGLYRGCAVDSRQRPVAFIEVEVCG